MDFSFHFTLCVCVCVSTGDSLSLETVKQVYKVAVKSALLTSQLRRGLRVFAQWDQ